MLYFVQISGFSKLRCATNSLKGTSHLLATLSPHFSAVFLPCKCMQNLGIRRLAHLS
jgi:hypothetical protein